MGFMKCRYLDGITGGKGVIFATGTPVSNSMVELYTIFKLTVADDNCVDVAGRNPRTEFLPVLGFKILFGGHKQVGGRVKLEPA